MNKMVVANLVHRPIRSLISVVAVWNNYFLPLLIFNVNTKYPLVVGLGLWSERAQNSGTTVMATT